MVCEISRIGCCMSKRFTAGTGLDVRLERLACGPTKHVRSKLCFYTPRTCTIISFTRSYLLAFA